MGALFISFHFFNGKGGGGGSHRWSRSDVYRRTWSLVLVNIRCDIIGVVEATIGPTNHVDRLELCPRSFCFAQCAELKTCTTNHPNCNFLFDRISRCMLNTSHFPHSSAILPAPPENRCVQLVEGTIDLQQRSPIRGPLGVFREFCLVCNLDSGSGTNILDA